MMNRVALIQFVLFYLISFHCLGNKDSEQAKDEPVVSPIQFQLQYLADAFYNVSGGIKTGGTYMGLLNFSFALDLQKAGWWQGGNIQVKLFNYHGGMASAGLTGDWQVISNIENLNSTCLYEAWMSQQIGRFNFLAGIHDINNHFFISATGAEFSNSSFGLMPTLTLNVPISTYPVNSLGLLANYRISDQVEISTGLYDGQPGCQQEDPCNLTFDLNKEDSYFWVNEMLINYALKSELQGTLKFGFNLHGGRFPHLHDSSKINPTTVAFHLLLDQEIFNEEIKSFLQLGYAPGKEQVNSAYLGGGLAWENLLLAKDLLGAGFAWAKMSRLLPPRNSNHEVDLELFYRWTVNSHLSLQPNFHYIINPGIDQNLQNVFAGALRLQMLF